MTKQKKNIHKIETISIYTKKDLARYHELLELARKRFFNKTCYFMYDWLNDKEKEEFVNLDELINGGSNENQKRDN